MALLGWNEVEDRATKIIASMVRLPREEVTLGSHLHRDLGFESVQDIEIIARLEEEFGFEFDEDEALSRVHTVADAIDLVLEKVPGQMQELTDARKLSYL